MTVNASMIAQLLRERYPEPEWATFTELADQTGGAARRIDFAAFNLYNSKGGLRVAYEIKVSRQDFLHELDHPEKRAFAEENFSQCYFAVAHGVVKSSDEVPEGWGLLVTTRAGDKLIRRKAAQHRDPKPPSLMWMLALMRRFHAKMTATPMARYAGKEVTLEELDELVAKRVSWERERLRAEQRRLVQAQRAANAEAQKARQVTAPLITLLQHAGGHYKWPDGPITSAHVVQWADAARSREARSLRASIRGVVRRAERSLAEVAELLRFEEGDDDK